MKDWQHAVLPLCPSAALLRLAVRGRLPAVAP